MLFVHDNYRFPYFSSNDNKRYKTDHFYCNQLTLI